MKKAGIYQIINNITNKSYIGSSKSINNRWNVHRYLLKMGKHSNKHLQYSWNKYGEKNFNFIILEECNINDLITREQFFIDTFKPEYNIREIASSNEGFNHTIKSKDKISKASILKWQNSEIREKIIKGNQKKIICYNKEGYFIKEFSSIKEAALELSIFPTNISKILKGKGFIIKGYHFKYYTNNYNLKIQSPLELYYKKKYETIIQNTKNRKK